MGNEAKGDNHTINLIIFINSKRLYISKNAFIQSFFNGFIGHPMI